MEWLMGSAAWTVRSNALVRYDGINRKRGRGAENLGTER
jgi:hypothetical protein